MPGARRGFGLVPAQASGPFYPCPAGPALPILEACYWVQMRRDIG